MENNKYDIGLKAVERENLYLGLINECSKRIDGIRQKITIITSPSLAESAGDTPNRTELEAELKRLLQKIKELENDIVV